MPPFWHLCSFMMPTFGSHDAKMPKMPRCQERCQNQKMNESQSSLGAILKVMDTAIFFIKCTFTVLCLFVSLYEVEVHIQVLSHFFSARTKNARIQIQNGHCHLVRLGVKRNRVLIAFLSTNPWRTATF